MPCGPTGSSWPGPVTTIITLTVEFPQCQHHRRVRPPCACTGEEGTPAYGACPVAAPALRRAPDIGCLKGTWDMLPSVGTKCHGVSHHQGPSGSTQGSDPRLWASELTRVPSAVLTYKVSQWSGIHRAYMLSGKYPLCMRSPSEVLNVHLYGGAVLQVGPSRLSKAPTSCVVPPPWPFPDLELDLSKGDPYCSPQPAPSQMRWRR